MMFKIFKCRFNNPKCKDRLLGCVCGKGGESAPAAPVAPPQPSQEEIAMANLQAQLKTAPQAAQLQYDILANPQYGLGATNQLYQQVQQQAFPGGYDVQQQLAQTVLRNLMSPTGISAEQQGAINARRGESQDQLVNAIRERANLGGGLWGGRAIGREAEEVGNLQNIFAEEDIGREERSRLNALNAAIPILQMFMGQQVQAPQYQSAAASGEGALSAATQARGQDVGLASSIYQGQLASQAQQDAADSAMWGSLFEATGGSLAAFLAMKGAK